MQGYEIQVVIPVHIEAVGSATAQQVRESTEHEMIDRCGGCTIYDSAKGKWDGPTGVVGEHVHVYTCVGEFDGMAEALAFAEDLADTVDQCTTEDSVFYQAQIVGYGST